MESIKGEFAQAGITGLSPTAYEQFHSFHDLLSRWNERLNLTAIREPQQIIRRHFVECAFAAQHLPLGIGTLLDYGSGAGFPGIPIAICRPDIHVTLAEAQGKKAAFLREALRVLNLKAEIYDGRVETMAQQNRYDAVTMRAVEKMETAIPVAGQRAKQYLVLLTTSKSATLSQTLTPELEWLDPIPLPNAEHMILAIGRHK